MKVPKEKTGGFRMRRTAENKETHNMAVARETSDPARLDDSKMHDPVVNAKGPLQTPFVWHPFADRAIRDAVFAEYAEPW